MSGYVHGASGTAALKRTAAHLRAENYALKQRLNHQSRRRLKPQTSCRANMNPEAYAEALERDYRAARTQYPDPTDGTARLRAATQEARDWDKRRRTPKANH